MIDTIYSLITKTPKFFTETCSSMIHSKLLCPLKGFALFLLKYDEIRAGGHMLCQYPLELHNYETVQSINVKCTNIIYSMKLDYIKEPNTRIAHEGQFQ